MAGAPALLLGVLGIVGRTQVATWEFESYTHQQTQDILAYQEPVRTALALKGISDLDPVHIKHINDVADFWLRLKREGRLNNVVPGSLQDQGSEGVKEQILEARQVVLNKLNLLASKQRHDLDWAQASLTIAKGIAIADIFKYSGLAAMQQSALSQASGLRVVRGTADGLPPKTRSQVAALLMEAFHQDNPIGPLAEEISHLSIKAKMRRGESLADLNSVFQVSHLEEIAQEDLRHAAANNGERRSWGLDIPIANTLSAVLKTEAKVHAEIRSFVEGHAES